MSEETPKCSGGAEMLIQRMKDYPEEFVRDGRFAGMIRAIIKDGMMVSNLQGGVSRRDREALLVAYEALVEDLFTENVTKMIFENQSPAPTSEIDIELEKLRKQYFNQKQAMSQANPWRASPAVNDVNSLAGIGQNSMGGIANSVMYGSVVSGQYDQPGQGQAARGLFDKMFGGKK